MHAVEHVFKNVHDMKYEYHRFKILESLSMENIGYVPTCPRAHVPTCPRAQPGIYAPPDSHDLCIPLYQGGQLGLDSLYPPLETDVHIVPRPSEIKIKMCKYRGTRLRRKFYIDGLSSHMLPTNVIIEWTITCNSGKTIRKLNKNEYYHDFQSGGVYKVVARIILPECKPVETKANVVIMTHHDDMIEYDTQIVPVPEETQFPQFPQIYDIDTQIYDIDTQSEDQNLSMTDSPEHNMEETKVSPEVIAIGMCECIPIPHNLMMLSYWKVNVLKQ
jgi:hypothetical protein